MFPQVPALETLLSWKLQEQKEPGLQRLLPFAALTERGTHKPCLKFFFFFITAYKVVSFIMASSHGCPYTPDLCHPLFLVWPPLLLVDSLSSTHEVPFNVSSNLLRQDMRNTETHKSLLNTEKLANCGEGTRQEHP